MKSLVCLLFLLGFTCFGASRPNVLFLFTDDQRADTIHALGNRNIVTPNLDQLARRGLSFKNAYSLGANTGAVCTPSRNMLLSGKVYSRWNGLLAPATPHTFPAVMRAAGYETYHHGKNLNTATAIQSQFEHNLYLAHDEKERMSGQPGKEIVDRAVHFLQNRRKDRPFFMYLAFANPHDVRVAAPEFREKYQKKNVPLPKNFLPEHPFDNGELKVRDEKLAPWPRTPEIIRQQLLDYYATITGLDFHIGRLLEVLKSSGYEANTIILFSSDHGLAIGSHGLMGKQNLYEHSLKVPLIMVGPDIQPGKSDALVYLMDIFPTIAEKCGAAVPKDLDGRSFLPLLNGNSKKGREHIFGAYREVQRSIRDERWKLIRYPEIGKEQLFDLKNDPEELKDRVADFPEHVSRLRTHLENEERALMQ